MQLGAYLEASVHSSWLGVFNQLQLGLGSVRERLERIQQSRLAVCNGVQSGVYLGAYTQVGWECAINCIWDLVAYLGAYLGVHNKVRLEAWSMQHHV